MGDASEKYHPQPPVWRSEPENRVWIGAWVGIIAAVVGLIDGAVMALKRVVADCPNGKYFPEGTTDFTCYAHPKAELGIAVIAVSVALGVIVVLAAVAASAAVRPPAE
ncbi:hypothetical protein E8D34_11880 [Nocardioides sp. GY 10113]|uniref:hypothetical protein n=1 Tax=Nocardioides sp. GY 10113 TaxID=2569761 RepID=UPI0010A89425|nr:hypothetical protein [Nocardioides sp. GY 10113]TIC79678.1 hypothetical protein E8D34_20070 [Nocardioides sp. GY 10113]TIC85803.1 hypothetical protein E8D34_11880 [Nocardioides sp. GY 10113]